MALADQYQHKTADEVRNMAVSFVGLLDVDEELTGTPTIEVSPSGLTISQEQVSTERRTINNKWVDAGKAVQCSVEGGTVAERYQIIVTCDTDATPPQTLQVTCYLDIEEE
jgi:hypothetical protein